MPAIVGFGKAVEIAQKEMDYENPRFRRWSEKILAAFANMGAKINGHPTERLPHNINIRFPNIESKAIINSISKQVAISAGSACTTQTVKPSHVLLALGLDENAAHSSIRIGMGRFNTDEEIDYLIAKVSNVVSSLFNIRTEVTYDHHPLA